MFRANPFLLSAVMALAAHPGVPAAPQFPPQVAQALAVRRDRSRRTAHRPTGIAAHRRRARKLRAKKLARRLGRA